MIGLAIMAKRKTRAPGGGRKQRGEFSNLTVRFSMRMPENLRDQLEAEATASGRSASQELLRRLQNSLERDRDRQRDPALQGLLFFIAEIAEGVSLGDLTEDEEERSRTITRWRNDP